jgi:DNA-binding MarR family transcriptional regulator/GNAT superfamily N-acetyltransferase
MDRAAVDSVRAFNRTVTQRLGVLEDEYLGRGRPLGASRVMWEIGENGTDLRTLRTALDLDSGYLSRLVRSLEADGLIAVEPDPADKRVRTVRLTAAGRVEREVIDSRSDDLAWSFLAPLNDSQRTRLVGAMVEVERLLTAGLVEVAVEDPRTPAARACIDAYFAELDERVEGGFDPSITISADPDELVEPRGLLLLARLRDEPVGCAALKLHGDEPAEIKRMWVAPHARGLGVGRRLLTEVEEHAVRRGARVLRLETIRELHEASALYRSAGYSEVAPFNDEPHADHWFEKPAPRPGDS